MTFDDKPDPDELDELASAVLDGEATDAEREQVASDPQLTAREQVFRQIAERVGSATPADDAARESTLAAVLAVGAAASEPPGSSDNPDAATASGAVVPLVRPRSRGRSWRFAPAVAAVVIVLLAIPALLIALNRDSGVRDVALPTSGTPTSAATGKATSGPSTTAASTTTSETASAEASGASGSPRSYDASPDAAATADLGTLRSSGELGDSVKQQLAQPRTLRGASPKSTTTVPAPTGAPSTTTTTPPLSGTPPPAVDCESTIRDAVPGLGDLLLRAIATYQNAPAQVYGFDDPRSEGTIVIVTDASTCTIVEQTAA